MEFWLYLFAISLVIRQLSLGHLKKPVSRNTQLRQQEVRPFAECFDDNDAAWMEDDL